MRKTVLITGCSSGFGLLTALKFYKEGWCVVGIVRGLTDEVRAKIPNEIELFELDITHQKRIPSIIKKIFIKYERIDVLVNNAGVGSLGLFEQHNEETIRYLFEVNVFGLMNMTKAILPYMRREYYGIIINVSSIRGLIGSPLRSIYSATKFAVQGFSESLQSELRAWNIQVKTILPHAYPTNFKRNSIQRIHIGCAALLERSTMFVRDLKKRKKSTRQNRIEPDPNEIAVKIFEMATISSPIQVGLGEPEKELLSS